MRSISSRKLWRSSARNFKDVHTGNDVLDVPGHNVRKTVNDRLSQYDYLRTVGISISMQPSTPTIGKVLPLARLRWHRPY